MLSFADFEKKYLSFDLDDKLLCLLKNILCLNTTIHNKQRRIEKLLNVFLLSKETNLLKLNPL